MNITTKHLLAVFAAFAMAVTSVAFANESTQNSNQQTCAMEADDAGFETKAEYQEYMAQCLEELSSQASVEEAVIEVQETDAEKI